MKTDLYDNLLRKKLYYTNRSILIRSYCMEFGLEFSIKFTFV